MVAAKVRVNQDKPERLIYIGKRWPKNMAAPYSAQYMNNRTKLIAKRGAIHGAVPRRHSNEDSTT
jgi:hypothetical protein